MDHGNPTITVTTNGYAVAQMWISRRSRTN